MRLPSAATGAILAGLLSMPAFADTLDMPPGDGAPAGSAEAQYEVPTKGLNMRQVEERFGTPVEKVAPVGDPPIARWIYDDFTVYFEHQYVIHSVVDR